MEDAAYGIGITNRYDFLLDTESIDPQAILKQKAKKAKKAAKKLAGKENAENDAKPATVPEKVVDEKKVKFVAKGVKPSQQQQPELTQKSRSMKDTQNIQGNADAGNTGNATNGFRETKGNFNRERNYGNNRNFENRDNREQRFNRRNNNRDGGADPGNDAGLSQENGEQPSRGYRTNNRNYENRNYENKQNENTNNGQEIEYNNQRDNDRDNERPARRQGYDRNFGNRDGNRDGNRRYDGQRRNFEGRGGKREFDRQSGSDKTGVKAVEKRDGGGAHNWGTHKQDIEDLNKNVSEPDLNKDDGNSDENAKSEENLAVEPVLLTLDEYKTLQGERAKPVFNTRKAGEGEDKKKWKNLVPLEKKKEEVKGEEEMEIDMSMFPQRKRGVKYIKDIRVCFNEGKQFGNNRNKFRKNVDGRNGRNRNDDSNRQNAPRLDDRNFPSLG